MHDLVYLRAPRALNDSNGNRWPAPGAVVGVPHEQAVELLQIRDAGFVVVDAPDISLPDLDELEVVTEPAPAPAQAVTEPAPAAPVRKPRRPRKPVTE